MALVAILAFSNPSKEDYVNRCMLSKVKKPTTNLVEYAKDAIVTAVAKKALESLIERTDFIVLSIYKNTLTDEIMAVGILTTFVDFTGNHSQDNSDKEDIDKPTGQNITFPNETCQPEFKENNTNSIVKEPVLTNNTNLATNLTDTYQSNLDAEPKNDANDKIVDESLPHIITNAVPNTVDEKAVLDLVVSFYSDFLLTDYSKTLYSSEWLFSEKRLTPNLRLCLKRTRDYVYLDSCPIACGNGGVEGLWVFASVEVTNDVATIIINRKFVDSSNGWKDFLNDWQKISIQCVKSNLSWQISDINSFISYKPKLFFVNAKNGLILRENPSVSSKKLTLMPYMSVVEIDSDSGTPDKIDGINGQWLNLDFYSKETGYLYGYCFSNYVEKINLSTPLAFGVNKAIVMAILGSPREVSPSLLTYSDNDFIRLENNVVMSWSGFEEFKEFFVKN